MSKLLTFIEPHPTGGCCTVTLTEEQAIAAQRKLHDYTSDADALNDFIVVNWAEMEDSRSADRVSLIRALSLAMSVALIVAEPGPWMDTRTSRLRSELGQLGRALSNLSRHCDAVDLAPAVRTAAKALQQAALNVLASMIPGMSWTDDVGQQLKRELDDALTALHKAL